MKMSDIAELERSGVREADESGARYGETFWEQDGMTLRQYAAIHIAAGIATDDGYSLATCSKTSQYTR